MDQVFCGLYARNFFLSQNIWTFSRDHPTTCSMGNGAPSIPGCEVVRCNVEHSPSFNAKAKTDWSYTATTLMYLNGVNRAMFFHLFLTDK